MKQNLKSIFSLKNKVIIVTGAAGLLGEKHIEAILAFEGIPILIDINKSKIEIVKRKLNKQFKNNIDSYILDITNEDDIKKNSYLIQKKYGRIDGLINNAANNPSIENDKNEQFSRLEHFPLETWNQDIAVGLTGSFLCAKYYGHIISKNKDGGSIINISSDLGLIAPDQRLYEEKNIKKNQQKVKPVSYSVVKTGIIGLTRYLATYWNESPIRCNAICPGGITNNQHEDFLDKVNYKIPLGRLAFSNEYQGVIVWMLSDASSYLNGAIIPVDGGRTAW